MYAQLFRYQNDFYINFDNEVYRHLDVKGIKDFLRHYSEKSYYETLKTTSAPEMPEIAELELIACVDDNYSLTIINPELMQIVLATDHFPYITTDEFAEKHNRKKRIVLRLCSDGRIEGAIQVNSVWLIPEDAPYPADARVGARVPSSRTLVKRTQE